MALMHIPWYSTLFRADEFERAVMEIAPKALEYGAKSWFVHRSTDDPYKFLQAADFASSEDWETYWYGPEFSEWRAKYSSWYQVPIVPVYGRVVGAGEAKKATA